jgi:signal transduction histidine kinase
VTDEAARLQAGFAEFVAAARELERAYTELKARAAAVDLELGDANRALQQAIAERDAVFAALPVGLTVLRGDGTVASRNPEAERLRAAAAAHAVDLERRADGEVAFAGLSVRVRRAAVAGGEVVLLEDRSHVQRLEREVHRLDRLAGLSELALGIAHEIKNPLNGVQGFAALLERADDREQMRRFAGKVVQGVRQVDDIVKALLGFARPDQRRGRVATVADVVGEAAAAASLPLARVQLTGARDERADADALARVLANLLVNAVEASPAVHVRVHAAVRTGRLELTVHDDGPGVPATLAARVFEPFVTTKARGTGLGLPLCLRVLAFLGGDLELVNPGEPGACFRVRVPLLAGAAADAAGEDAA